MKSSTNFIVAEAVLEELFKSMSSLSTSILTSTHENYLFFTRFRIFESKNERFIGNP